ncbi:uncharacterized protein PGTG_22403 [Puccinia graminis f. sp. tritici CRL 75-36-700-3]|uniref:Uncharacterized protein n=1 Tax=Puccinia graminis f. sp. tritici (strain CRL 75-36-700-3 / race SCCL) TaxID=418459 RepID=H6QUI2_PUCGT|nr:uncharacterized protein PGTG_22403 [Puccinia graminis f. sp. tritici CRL 75-36-700-3]EHS64694.1 hypothetical protein PGTG_22403 [Puccinia graminis f. sp. tritici CRL 75-36-700-3]
MGPEDYSTYLDGVDQITNWLDDQPSDNDALASESRSVSVVNTAANTQQEEPNSEDKGKNKSEDFKVSIEYKLYVALKKPKPTTTRAGRKAVASETNDKYSKLVSKPNKLSFTWNASNTNLDVFKEAVLEILRALEPSQVFGLAEKQEKAKNLCWYAIIPYGGQFVEKNQTMLDNSKIFLKFLEVAEGKGEAKIHLVQNDPKAIAERDKALKQLSEQEKANDEDEAPSSEPTAGASLNKKIIDNMWLIRATHMPKEDLTGSMELPVMVDPADSRRFIALSPD